MRKDVIMPILGRKKPKIPAAMQGQPQDTEPLTAILDGRRYYSNAPYALPKDLQEINRLDLQHYFLRCSMRGNYMARLDPESLHNILDVGCGTARWCIEMAQAFPRAQVIGVDLERGENSGVTLPSNYQFVAGNVLKGLPFADHTFEYVHQRLLVMGVPVNAWVTELQELLRVTHPGGIIELVEAGTTFLPAGEQTQRWCEWGMRISAPRGLDPSAIPNLVTFARQAGLQEIQAYHFDLPIGDWHGKLKGWEARMGQLLLVNLRALYESGIPLLQAELKLDTVTRDTMLQRLEDEWARMHTKLRYFIVLGKKPERQPHQQPMPGTRPTTTSNLIHF
jgi:SAM-dependent methyltransferase